MNSSQVQFIRGIEIGEVGDLDHRTLANALRRAINLACLPYRIALFGPWGSGKTSVMRRVADLLEEQNQANPDDDTRPFVRSLWYNPWEQESDGLISGLVQAISETLSEDIRFSKKGARVIFQASDALRAISERGAIEARPKVRHYSSPHLELRGGQRLDHLRESMRRLVRLASSSGERSRPRRLVVFVDDLDKCQPESVLAFLEACKIYFADTRVVFVVSLDQEVLANAVDLKYGDGFASDRYLDKIFDFAFEVHPLEWSQLAAIVGDLYHRSQLGERLDEATQARELAAIERAFVTPGIVAHPRNIKRIFNRFVWYLAGLNGTEGDPLWLTWILISVYWPGFRHLVSCHGAEVIGELFNRVTGNLLFPHGNDQVREQLDKLNGYRSLLDYFRNLYGESLELSPSKATEQLKQDMEAFVEINSQLRANGL